MRKMKLLSAKDKGLQLRLLSGTPQGPGSLFPTPRVQSLHTSAHSESPGLGSELRSLRANPWDADAQTCGQVEMPWIRT